MEITIKKYKEEESKMKKRIFIGFLVLVFSLTGLSFSSAIGKEKVDLGKIPTEPITIYMWSFVGDNYKFWKKATDMYTEEHPNVKFDITAQDSDYILHNMFTVLATKPKKMDMMECWTGTRIKELYEDGSIMKIEHWYDYYNWDKKLLPQYRQNIIPGVGLAFFCSSWMTHSEVFYNTKMFEDNGLTPPDSIDGFLTLCEKLKSAGIQPLAVGGKDGWPWHLIWNQMIARYMPASRVEKLHKWVLDPNRSAETAEVFRSEGVIKTFRFIEKLASEGYCGKAFNTMGFEEQVEYYRIGKAAMMFGFLPSSIFAIKNVKPDFPLDYLIMPPNGEFKAIPIEFMDGVVIPSRVKDNPKKQAVIASLLNKLVVDMEYIKEAQLKMGLLSVSKLMPEPDEIVEISGEPLIARVLEDIERYGGVTITDDWLPSAMVNVYYTSNRAVAQGTMTPKEAAQKMYEAAVDILEW